MTITINLQELTQTALLNALANFCRIHGAPVCYQNWSPETLRDYLAFHAEQQTLTWIASRPIADTAISAIVATGVAWQCCEHEIRAIDAAGEHQFNWQPTNPAGDSVFFADFVCSAPGTLESLIADYAVRFPQWARLKWFTYRRGKLKPLTRRHLKIVLRKAGIHV